MPEAKLQPDVIGRDNLGQRAPITFYVFFFLRGFALPFGVAFDARR